MGIIFSNEQSSAEPVKRASLSSHTAAAALAQAETAAPPHISVATVKPAKRPESLKSPTEAPADITPSADLAALSINLQDIEDNWRRVIQTGDPKKDLDILSKIMEMIKSVFGKLFRLRASSAVAMSQPGLANSEKVMTSAPGPATEMAKLAKRVNQLASTLTPPISAVPSNKSTAKTLWTLKSHAATAELASALELTGDISGKVRAIWRDRARAIGLDPKLSDEGLRALASMSASDLKYIDQTGELHGLASTLPRAVSITKSKVESLVALMHAFALADGAKFQDLVEALHAKKLSLKQLVALAQETDSQVAKDGLIAIAKHIGLHEPNAFASSDLAALLPSAANKAADAVVSPTAPRQPGGFTTPTPTLTPTPSAELGVTRSRPSPISEQEQKRVQLKELSVAIKERQNILMASLVAGLLLAEDLHERAPQGLAVIDNESPIDIDTLLRRPIQSMGLSSSQDVVSLIKRFCARENITESSIVDDLRRGQISVDGLITAAKASEEHAKSTRMITTDSNLTDEQSGLSMNHGDMSSTIRGLVPPAPEKSDQSKREKTQEPTPDIIHPTFQLEASQAGFLNDDEEPNHPRLGQPMR